ncbi:MAG: rhomboid family intramembrane serine protease [Treponema sp.]
MKWLREPFRYEYRHSAFKIAALNIFILFLTANSSYFYRLFALTPILMVRAHMYWQVFTYQFLHGDFWHLFSNMLGILIFGTAVEKKIGSREFLLFYLLTATLCGVAACAGYLLIGFERVSLIGASGAVFAVLYLFAVLYPDSTIFVFGLIPMPAPILVIIYGCMEVYDMLFTHDSVAHSVHLSGLFFAWLYIRVRFRIKPMKVWQFSR